MSFTASADGTANFTAAPSTDEFFYRPGEENGVPWSNVQFNATPTEVTIGNQPIATTVVSSSPNSSVYGQTVQFTATVSASNFDNGGTVQFAVDGSNYGLPQPLNNSGTATIQDSDLSVSGSPHVITATYSGDTAFGGSPGTLTGGQTVTPYAFNYTIGNDNQTYGTAANLATALGTTIVTGVNGQNLAITYSSTGDTATAHVNSYAITGVLADGTGQTGDYTVTLIPGTLTVKPYAFSDTIGNDSQTYGTAANLATALGTTIVTGVNGQNLAITYSSTGDTATAHVNTYPITGVLANGTGLTSDYTVTLIHGTLTVKPYAFSYTIGNDSQTYGTAANLATDSAAHDCYGGQRPEPGDHLQQHGRHGHGPCGHLRHHRRGGQWHGSGERLHGDPDPRHVDREQSKRHDPGHAVHRNLR